MNRRTLLIATALLALAACSKGGKTDESSLSVAATAVPHAEILEHVKPALAKEGVNLEIRVFNDYVQPNMQVAQKQIDVNYFQTKPYLDDFNANRGTKLVTFAGIHVEPMGGYSRKWKSLDQLPNGAEVAIPNDPSSTGRALVLMEKAGLLTLKKPGYELSTLGDIASNPKNLQFKELEAAAMPRVLDQLDLALINTNYALDARLSPIKDALLIEGKDSPYLNYVVGLEERRNDPKIVKLIAALKSADAKAFIERNYAGAVLPAF